MIPDFQTWRRYPNGMPFPVGTKIRISPDAPTHPRCFGYVRGYRADGQVLVEVPHVGQDAPEAYKIEYLTLWRPR